MRVICVTHAAITTPGVFQDVIEHAGHQVEIWNIAERQEAPDVRADDAVIVFGGDQTVDSFDEYPWLRVEDALLRNLLARRVPTFGVCMGAQLLVQAVGGSVYRAAEPELGWTPVELVGDAHRDPVLGALPRHFDAINWHVDTWSLPAEEAAVELATSDRYPQAVRVGERAWGVQFHPEVTGPMMKRLVDREIADVEEREKIWSSIEAGIDKWNSLGKSLCEAFINVAEETKPEGKSRRPAGVNG